MLDGYSNTMTVFSIKNLYAYGNNLKYKSTDTQIFIDHVIDNIDVVLDPPIDKKLAKVVIEGDFLIGVEEGRERIMYIYKCHKNIMIRGAYDGEQMKDDNKPTFNCRQVSIIVVNSPVKLTDAKQLGHFLMVRFRSDNSVVYYKIDMYEYTFTEINLKGYDPTQVWMVESDPNTIIICHFKSTSVNPYMLFSLHGEVLTRLPIPNFQQFVQPDINMKFLAGGLATDKSRIYMYIGISYPQSISFLKYDVTNAKDISLQRSGHNLLHGSKIDPLACRMCFLLDKIVILYIDPYSEPSSDDKLRLFIMDVDNPTLENEYPLKQYNISSLLQPEIHCDTINNIISLRGGTANGKKTTAFLNGDYSDASTRVMEVLSDKVGLDCTLNKARHYFAEVCMTANSSSNFPVSIRFNRMISPRVLLRHDNLNTVGGLKITTGETSQIVNFTSIVKPLICSPVFKFKPGFLDNIKNNPISEGEKVDIDILKTMIDYDCHMLQARIVDAKGYQFQPANHSLIPSTNIRPRIDIHREYIRTINPAVFTRQTVIGIDSITQAGSVVATITIFPRYHVISSWITLYKTEIVNDDGEFSVRLTKVGTHQIDSICSKISFDLFQKDNDTIVDLAVICGTEVMQYLKAYTATFNETSCVFKNHYESHTLHAGKSKYLKVKYLSQDGDHRIIGIMQNMENFKYFIQLEMPDSMMKDVIKTQIGKQK